MGSFLIRTGGVLFRFKCLHCAFLPVPSGFSPNVLNDGQCEPLSDESRGPNPGEGHPLLPPPVPSTATPCQSAVGRTTNMATTKTKTMVGELELAVVPDRSHKLFWGQRTIVRFRLTG